MNLPLMVCLSLLTALSQLVALLCISLKQRRWEEHLPKHQRHCDLPIEMCGEESGREVKPQP